MVQKTTLALGPPPSPPPTPSSKPRPEAPPPCPPLSQLWLDRVLPLACRLATSSPDRTERVAACELLHAVTLWMVGAQ